jgi:hypothetical protein
LRKAVTKTSGTAAAWRSVRVSGVRIAQTDGAFVSVAYPPPASSADAGADLGDGACTFEPNDVGSAGRRGVEAAPLQQVGPIDAGSCDGDSDLTVPEIG